MFRNKTISSVNASTSTCVSVSSCRRTQFWDSRYGSSRLRFFLPLEIFPPLDLCNGLLSASSFPLLSDVEREYLAREMVERDEFVSNETNQFDYSTFSSERWLDLIRLTKRKTIDLIHELILI